MEKEAIGVRRRTGQMLRVKRWVRRKKLEPKLPTGKMGGTEQMPCAVAMTVLQPDCRLAQVFT